MESLVGLTGAVAVLDPLVRPGLPTGRGRGLGVVDAIHQPDAKAALAAQGMQPVGNTPAEFAAIITADTARWGKVIRDANIQVGQ